MKKRHQLVSVIAAIFMIASLTGCNGLFSPEKSFDNEVSDTSLNYGGTAILTGVIENYDDIMRERNGKPTSKSNARLILPVLDGNLYDFYLFGERGSMFCGPYKLDSDSFIGQTSGTFKYRLPQGAWNLTLAAMEPGSEAPTAEECKGGLAAKAWLIAKSYIDLSQGQTKASFVLSPEGLSTNGKVKLNVYLEGWSLQTMLGTNGVRKNMTITAEIRDLKTNAIINTEAASEGGSGSPSSKPLTDSFKSANKAEYDGGGNYKPGTYNFVVTFKDDTEGKKAEWVWSDKIMIFPGVTTDEDVYISRIVQDPPKAPAALVVSYEGTQDLPATDEDQVFYKATFKWLGKYLEGENLKDITNETHFELEVANISGVAGKSLTTFQLDSTANLSDENPIKWSDDSAAASSIQYIKLSDGETPNTKSVIGDTSNTGSGTIKAYNYAVSKDNDYVKGSLYANNDEITLWLKLGEEYAARIRAVNKTGASPWTYVSLIDSAAPSTLNHATNTHLFLEKTINEYYIKYWLNGGDTNPSKYPIGYKMEFGPKKVTKEGDETEENRIGLRYWNAPKEEVKANTVLLSGWKRKSSDTNLYNVSKAQEINYTEATNIPTGEGATEAQKKLSEAGYKKTITRTIKTYYPDGLWKQEVKEFVSTKEEATAPADVDGKKPATPGSDWKHVKNCISTSTATQTTDLPDGQDIAYTPLLIYDGYQNIDLWAQYDTDFNWSFITNYKLKKENIKYQLGSYDGSTFTPATGYTPAKPLGGTNTNTATIVPSGNNYYIQWSIINDEEWKFTHYTVSVKPTDTSPYVIDRVRTTEIKDKNNATTIVTDLSSCAQGSVYLVTIDAGIPGTQYSDSVPIVLYVE